MYKIGFLILHYKVFDMTCQCIDSIYELEHPDMELGIMVVDNNSGNGSGEKLKEKYTQDNIEIMLLSESYGFSEGNNIGYEKMKKDNYDFIFVINNDIIFEQKDILIRLIKAYEEKSFYIAGPDIYCPPRERHQSPMELDVPTKEEVAKAIKAEKKKLKKLPFETFLNKLYVAGSNTWLYRFYRKVYGDKHEEALPEKAWREPSENIVLQGAAFIVSKKFIDEASTLLTPITKFYHEELILTLRCRNNGWNNRYIPDMKVTHMESISSKTSNYYNNRKFRYVNFIESAEILLDYMIKIENGNVSRK